MRKFIYIVMIVQCTIITNMCFGQVQQEWLARYIGPGTGDFMSSMVIDKYGNVYVTGSGDSANLSNFVTVKYSDSGMQQWAARYRGGTGAPNQGSEAFSLAIDHSGNVYVAGYACPPGSNSIQKYTTVKYNSSGVQQWVAVYGGGISIAASYAYALTTDISGFVYVTGVCYFLDTGPDYTTIKYDSLGAQQWVARYHGPQISFSDHRAYRIATDNSSNVYVTGYSFVDSTGKDIATVKYNSSGVQQWVARYNGPANESDSATDLKVDNLGNVYVTGTSWGGDSTKYDYITIKYDSSGIQQWAARYNGSDNWTDIAKSIGVDSNGNVYVTGYTTEKGDILHCGTIQYSSSGVQQWVAIYDSANGDSGISLALDRFGYVYVSAEIFQSIRTHFATIKYSPSGVKQWAILSNANSLGETPVAIAVDSLGNVYVAGGDGHYVVIKYNQLTGIPPVSNQIPQEYRLYQNYPNPFNPNTKINFTLPKALFVKLSIYNSIGQLVKDFRDWYEVGYHSIEFDCGNLASGVYFYKIEAGEYVQTRKMVLLK